jgi:hypothetical protein
LRTSAVELRETYGKPEQDMCFSAGASFTAGVLLTFVGTETLRKVHKPSQIVFASIPAFFAFQQVAEGILWLTIGDKAHAGLQTTVTYIFLIMAQVLWPLIVPISVLLMEHNKIRKRILFALLAPGAAVAFYYLYGLVFYHSYAEIDCMHIAYQSTLQNAHTKTAVLFYLAATVAPLFVSSIKRTHLLGIIIALSFIASFLFYTRCLTSVWCFFAAVISFVVYYIIRDAHKKFHFNLVQGLLGKSG